MNQFSTNYIILKLSVGKPTMISILIIPQPYHSKTNLMTNTNTLFYYVSQNDPTRTNNKGIQTTIQRRTYKAIVKELRKKTNMNHETS